MIHLSEFLNRLKRKKQLKFPKDISSFDISKMSWVEPEIYFKGDEVLKKTFNGTRTWYEGQPRINPRNKDNTIEPIEFIIQSRTEFTSAFGDFVGY